MNQTCIVTGGAAGIGRGIVECLLRDGANVMIADRNERDGAETARELAAFGDRVAYCRTDVASERQIDEVVAFTRERWGRIDVVVNNVGTHFYENIEAISAEQWDSVIAADLRGHFLMSQKALPALKQSGRGNVVHISSVHARLSLPNFSVYAAAKGGIVSLSRVMALEWAPYGIRVNAILPGLVRSKQVNVELAELSEEMRNNTLKRMSSHIPIGRIGNPHDIGDLVVFLCSERASFITGAAIPVDGGISARLAAE